ncbi:MAG TPA: metalloregulator ArsR/SmtB family transcription factor [Prosthecobacter sp.]|nr:metalloregulator ArsR/SmtB family transcription factor [Prosthecobacter sp.]HRK16362.1 metalloregulator ArsR/SmtB family transcription factor [Prosthecobacter sp.]
MQAPIAFARAIADETRFRVIHLLHGRVLCVCELAEILELPQSTLSSHLRVIARAGMLDCERRGKWLFYRVKPSFRPLLRVLFKHFQSTPAEDKALASDQRKALRRIDCRDAGCCPSPAMKTSSPSRK